MAVWIKHPDRSGQCCDCKETACESCCKDYSIEDLFWSGPGDLKLPGTGGFINPNLSIFSFGLTIPSSCKPYRVTLNVVGELRVDYPDSVSIQVLLGDQRKIEALVGVGGPGDSFQTKPFNITLSEDVEGENGLSLQAGVIVLASAFIDARGVPGAQYTLTIGPAQPPP